MPANTLELTIAGGVGNLIIQGSFMDKNLAKLLGAMGALAVAAPGVSASPASAAASMEAHSYADLLRRIGRMSREIEAGAATPAALTPRERTIQHYIGAGFSNKDIARQLNISVGTAKSHVHNILGKLNLTNRAQVAARVGGARRMAD